MAWISVHESVVGAKLRLFAKELNASQNEALGLLITLWLWGIHNADRYGKIVGATKSDVAKVIYSGLNDKLNPIDSVDALIKTNWIDIDEDGLYIHDWNEWQKQWYKAIDVRDKDRERKRKEKLRQNESDASKKTEKASSSDKQTDKAYSTDFEDFWNVYPRKVGKGEAYKKYLARLNDGWSPEQLLQSAKKYRSQVVNERTEEKYIKHAKTFLSENTPFADYLTKTERQASKPVEEENPYASWED